MHNHNPEAVHFDTYAYSSVVSGTFGLHGFAKACHAKEKGNRYYSQPFDSGRWKICIKLSPPNDPGYITVCLCSCKVHGEEETSSGARLGQFTCKFTLRTDQTTMASDSLVDKVFRSDDDIWPAKKFFQMSEIDKFVQHGHHDVVMLDYVITETRTDLSS